MSNLQSTKDFIASRQINSTGVGAGPGLPPQQAGQSAVPVVTNLRLLQTQTINSGTQFTIAWDDPTGSYQPYVDHFNIYVNGTIGSTGSINATSLATKSPGVIFVNTMSATVVTITVQTVLKNGYVSDLKSSPSITGNTVAQLSFLPLTNCGVNISRNCIQLTNIQLGTAGAIFFWDQFGNPAQSTNITIDSTSNLVIANNIKLTGTGSQLILTNTTPIAGKVAQNLYIPITIGATQYYLQLNQ